MKFKVGDKVRVRKDLREGFVDLHGRVSYVTYDMVSYAGREVTIREVYNGYCAVNENIWSWDNDLLEPLGSGNAASNKVVIITDGVTTTAKLYAGKNLVRESKAVCSEADTFSFEEGAKIVLERVMKETKKKEVPKALVCIKSNENYFTVGKKYMVKDAHLDESGKWVCFVPDDFTTMPWAVAEEANGVYHIIGFPEDAELVPFIDSKED